MTVDLYHPAALATASAMERASDFATWAPKLQSAAAIAREVCQTDFVPGPLRGSPAAVTAAILAGSEMGLGPMSSLMHVHIIDGRPSLSSEMQRALVLSLGHHIRYREMTTTRCVVEGQRRGEADWTTVTWTLDDAKRASLDGRQNWRRYPRRMLAARATGELCRMLFADALAGMPYSAEELEDEADDVAAATGPENQQPPQRTAQRASRRVKAGDTPSPAPAPDRQPAPATPASAPQNGQPPLPGEDDPPDPEPVDDTERHKALVGIVQQHFTRLALRDRNARLLACEKIAGTGPLESSKDLTVEQLSAVADTLARCKNGEQLNTLLIAGDKPDPETEEAQ